MLINIFRSLYSFGAVSLFEKERLRSTYPGDTDPPCQSSLEIIFETLQGRDTETRADVAFDTLLIKLQNSENLKKWNYVIKNLLIFDICLIHKIFINDIRESSLDHLLNYHEEIFDTKNLNKLVQKYTLFILEKSKLLSNKSSCFHVERSQLSIYFKSKTGEELVFELQNLLDLSQNIFEIEKLHKNGFLHYKLNQYVFLLLLQSLLNIYTCIYIGSIFILEKLIESDKKTAIQLKELYNNFVNLHEIIIKFINNHQYIEGFQLGSNDIFKPDTHILLLMSEYIENKEEEPIFPIENLINEESIIVSKEDLDLSKSTTSKNTSFNDLFEQTKLEMQDNLIKTDDFFKKIMKNYNEQDFESKILLPLKTERESTRKTLQNITGYNEDKVIYRKTLTKHLKRRETEKELLLGLNFIKSPSKLVKEPVLTLGGKRTSSNNSFKNLDEAEPIIRSPKKKGNAVCINMTESCFIEKNNEIAIGSSPRVSPRTSPRNRRKSFCPEPPKLRRITNYTCINFGPDFDDKIFETFPNSYSLEFNGENIFNDDYFLIKKNCKQSPVYCKKKNKKMK